MKFTKFLFISVILLINSYQGKSQEYYEQMNRFLKNYHTDSGLIDYFHIAKNDASLDSLYDAIGEMYVGDKDEDFLKAFYVNAYNIIVIKQVVVFYPISKPFDVNGFFDNIKNIVSGEEYTLDELEKDMIIPQFNDPRIHFALVCAAKGCPKMQNRAFKPETIEEDLERIAKEVINDPYFVNYENGILKVSKIFDWYKAEFSTGGTVISYINRYRNEPIPENSKIEYNEYDWSLNDVK